MRVPAAGDEVKSIDQPEARQVRIDPVVLRVGSDPDAQARSARVIKQLEYAWKDRLAQHQLVLARTSIQFQRRSIGVLTEAVPRIERVVGVAHTPKKQPAIKRHAMARVNLSVGVDQWRFGVEDETIEIKNERADHSAIACRRETITAGLSWSVRVGCRLSTE